MPYGDIEKEARWTDDRCPTCSLSWWLFPPVPVDECKPAENNFGPGSKIRCIGCKDTFEKEIRSYAL